MLSFCCESEFQVAINSMTVHQFNKDLTTLILTNFINDDVKEFKTNLVFSGHTLPPAEAKNNFIMNFVV